jgi:hypothetical protein
VLMNVVEITIGVYANAAKNIRVRVYYPYRAVGKCLLSKRRHLDYLLLFTKIHLYKYKEWKIVQRA